MKVFNFKAVFLSLCTLLSVSSCNNQENNAENAIDLTITTTEAIKPYLNDVIYKYNSSQKKYNLKINTLSSEDIKNYRLKNNVLDTDIVTFDNYVDANSFDNLLMDLSKCKFTIDYKVSIINSIKNSNNKLNVIPAIGKLYCNVINNELFIKHNFTTANTISELIDLAKRMEVKHTEMAIDKSSASLGGNDSILFSFMEIAYPLFLTSSEGNYFFKEYINGNTTISSSKFRSNWESIFKNLYKLYDENYYSIKDVNSTFNEQMNIFNESKVFSIQNSFKYNVASNINTDIDYSFIPFVGESYLEKWIGSKPTFYLSLKNGLDKTHYDGAIDFLNYYSSAEGQIEANKNTKSSISNTISYINDVYLPLDERYVGFDKIIKQGKVFIPDMFISTFRDSATYIYQYLNNDISLDELLTSIDSQIKKQNEYHENSIPADKTFDYTNKIYQQESSIGNFVIDSIRNSLHPISDVAVIPADSILENIYVNGLIENDISIILKNLNVVKVELKVRDLKSILIKQFENKTTSIPLISGIQIEKNGDSINIYNYVNKTATLLNDDDRIIALIYDQYLEDVNLENRPRYNIQDLLYNYIFKNKLSKIIMPKVDERYGDVL